MPSIECDFFAQDLEAIFGHLGINPYPMYDEKGNRLKDGENECIAVFHEDPNDEKPVMEQKYKVNEKEYMVRLGKGSCTALLTEKATGAHYNFALNVKGGDKFLTRR